MSIEIENDNEYIKERERITKNILDDIKIKQQNGRLWTPYHDMQLYEYVIKYNFNFFDIANRFQSLCNNNKKYEYSEDAVRLHWAFLHAMRMNNQIPNETYYQQMKLKYDKIEETSFKTVTQEKKDALSEEEDIKRMKEEFYKMQNEKKLKEEEEKNKNKEEEEKKKKEKEELEKKKKKEEEEKRKKKLQEEEEKKKKKKLEEERKRLEEENKPFKSSLYKEEPQFIKDLFSKEVPKEIKEKLEQDKGKYTKDTKETTNTNKNKPIDYSKISHDFTLIPIKPLIKDSDENTNKNNNNNKDEEELFPIKSNKQKNSSLEALKEHEKIISTKSLESQLKNTKNMNDYIQEDPILKKQYEQLNNFCKFATESINYIVNKETGINDISNTDEKKKTIEEANKKLNELFLGPIYEKAKAENFNLEEFNKKIDEEEKKMYFESTNYDNFMKTIPVDKDQDLKLKKFQEHLFAKANQMSTQELLDRISDIIKQPVSTSSSSTNLSGNSNSNSNNNNNNINNRIQNALNDVNSNDVENQDLNREMLNTVVRNINNNGNNNNNEEDEEAKSEKTKAQSETVNNDLNSSMNQMSEVSNIDKKYRHVYKGMVYYTDKPDENNNKNNNKNNNNKNKKNKNIDDELEYEDDSDDDDYNK
jgi:hypothetical protein